MGLSPHFGWGAAIAVQFKMSGCEIAIFSISSELIHSPPDLIRSLDLSTIVKKPSQSIVAISPVENHPSLSKASLVAFALLK